MVCDLGALVDADVMTLDALARLQLSIRRLGGCLHLRGASRELKDLLDLAGLCEALPPCGALRLEAGGETEQGKEPRGVEKEDDPADPAV